MKYPLLQLLDHLLVLPPHFEKLPGANPESHIYVMRVHMLAYAQQIQLSHLELKCAPLAYSYSLVMKIARANSSPARVWLTSERLSWPARSMHFILPNICQQSSGALNQGYSVLSQLPFFQRIIFSFVKEIPTHEKHMFNRDLGQHFPY